MSVIYGNILIGISIIIYVITMQQKDKKGILVGLSLVNLLYGIAYILLQSYSGSIICLIAVVLTIVKYIFDQKEKKFPLYLQIIFILISLIGGILTSHNLLDIIPAICSILYTFSILQSKEKNIRLITAANISLWIIFDTYAQAYLAVLFSIFTLTSTIIAIIRYDIRKEKKEEIKDGI